MASGSTISIRSPIRPSVGSDSASPLNAGSSSLDRSVPPHCGDDRGGIDRLAACAGNQRVGTSAPATPRSGRTGCDRLRPASPVHRPCRSTSSITGAEKSRLIDSRGALVDALERICSPSASSSRISRSSPTVAPLSAPISAVLQRDAPSAVCPAARACRGWSATDAGSPSRTPGHDRGAP